MNILPRICDLQTQTLNNLRGLSIFEEDFLEYLRSFHFTGDIYAIPEGTVACPKRANGESGSPRLWKLSLWKLRF